jgi:glucokinase
MILAGDTGGTKTRLALYQIKDGNLVRRCIETFVSSAYSGLAELAVKFLKKHNVSVDKACFGVPGPVINGVAQTTNLPWILKENDIARALNIPRIKLVNDLVATTAAVPHLPPDRLHILHKGRETDWQDSMCAVLAPGTGLGQAFLQCKSGQFQVFASEGGHVDFAPTNEIEVELFQYLKTKFERVSYERVLCGPGLVNIYTFLKDTGYAPEPPELSRRLQEEDAAAVISAAGQAGEFEICVKALDIFASVLGAQAGNLALTLMTTGGVFLGGGIPPKIVNKLADGTTVAAYLNKGRLSDLVKSTSLGVILDDHAAVLGAAHLAAVF